MALSKESIRLLREVGKAIVREYELYDQGHMPASDWFSQRVEPCNTPCCFSGWGAFVKGGRRLYNKLMREHGQIASDQMIGIFEITPSQANELFSDWAQKKKFNAAWTKPGTKEAALAGQAYIEDFIAKETR